MKKKMKKINSYLNQYATLLKLNWIILLHINNLMMWVQILQ